MEYKGIAYLRTKLAKKKPRVMRRYDYYEMKNLVKDLGISTPPSLRYWFNSLGWCGKAVDSLADRLAFREFANDNFGLTEIFNMNNRDVLIDSAMLGALIGSCDFIYITSDADGFPLMRVIDGRHATGIIDPITNMLREGYAILETDDLDRPVLEAHFMVGNTAIYQYGRLVDVIPNNAPYPLLAPIIYRPDSVRPFGHSRITRACMSTMSSAIRTIKRSEIAAEFYSYPQRYILGMENGADLDAWKATMSAMLRIDKDEDGDRPVVGQFQTASQTPHIDQLRMFAGIFAGETGLTLDDIGFPSENPSSSEAIKASHETLRLTARKAQRDFGVGLLNAGYLAACVRDDFPYKRRELYNTVVKWEPIFEPDASTLSLIGDGVIKINQGLPGYFTAEKLRDLTGF